MLQLHFLVFGFSFRLWHLDGGGGWLSMLLAAIATCCQVGSVCVSGISSIGHGWGLSNVMTTLFFNDSFLVAECILHLERASFSSLVWVVSFVDLSACPSA